MKKLYIYFAVVFASLAMTSCFDDPGAETFIGINEVEFDAGNLPNGLNLSLVRESDDQTDVVEVKVNRVSTTSEQAITVNIAADPSSTAISGVHYTLTSQSVTIPAGEFVAQFPVTFLTGNISSDENVRLVLKIDSATGASVSTAYGDLSINVAVVCPSNISVASDVWSATSVSRFGTFTANVTVTPLTAPGQYVISDVSAGLYAAFGFSTTQEAVYSDNCNELTFVGRRQTEFAISAPVVEPLIGSWNPATQTMVVYWNDPNNNINATTTLVKQ